MDDAEREHKEQHAKALAAKKDMSDLIHAHADEAQRLHDRLGADAPTLLPHADLPNHTPEEYMAKYKDLKARDCLSNLACPPQVLSAADELGWRHGSAGARRRKEASRARKGNRAGHGGARVERL